MAGRKYEAIDIVKLYSLGHYKTWNAMLTKCLKDRDINTLGKYLYQIQAGMDDCAKAKMNSDEIQLFFVRLTKSIEKTAKKILILKYPLPGDNPLIAKSYDNDWLVRKRKRDQELRDFLRNNSY